MNLSTRLPAAEVPLAQTVVVPGVAARSVSQLSPVPRLGLGTTLQLREELCPTAPHNASSAVASRIPVRLPM